MKNFYVFVLILSATFCSIAQVSINETFDNGGQPANWSFWNFFINTASPCAGSASIRADIYPTFETQMAEVQSPKWISNGQPLSISYSYKLLDSYTGVAVLNSQNWGYIKTQISTNNGFSYDTLAGVVNTSNHISSLSCAQSATYNVSGDDLPIGATIKVRLQCFLGGGSTVHFYIYLDNVVISQPVIVIPTCATALTPVASATAIARNVTLSWTAPSSLVTSYDVYFGTTTNPSWVSNQTTTTYTPPTLLPNTQYFWKVIPKNSYEGAVGCIERSFTTGSSLIYCASGANNVGSEDISNVTFGTLNNTSNCTNVATGPNSILNRYANYTSGAGAPAAPNVARNATIPFSFKMTSCATIAQDNSFSAYADWNQDGDLLDAGEILFIQATAVNALTNIQTGSIIVPVTASLGQTLLRIVLIENATNPRGCGNYAFGETEDYTINIVPENLDKPDYINLQFPSAATIITGENDITVYGQVYEQGLTDVEPGRANQAAGILAWVGVSPNGQNTNPDTWTTWIPAIHNIAFVNNNDEYQASIGASLAPGTYYYTFRYSLNGGPYTYGGNPSGEWNGTTQISGVLTVNPIEGDDCSSAINLPINQVVAKNSSNATYSLTMPFPTMLFSTVSKDLWFSAVVPAGQTALTFLTTSATSSILSDTVISAYSGTCGLLTEIGIDNDSGPERLSFLNLTGLTSGQTIYLRVWGFNGTSGAFNIIAAGECGIAATYVNAAQGWSFIPVLNQKAIISGQYSAGSFSACALDVIDNANVTPTATSVLTIKGAVHVAPTASLTLNNGVQLLQELDVENLGKIKVNRATNLKRLDYTFWSSPVAAQALQSFSPATLSNRFYTFNELLNSFTIANAANSFVEGTGYSIRAPNSIPSIYTATQNTIVTTWTGSFEGVPNNGNVAIQTTITAGAGNGYNLIGNPYPSALNGRAFLSVPENAGTLYFWTKRSFYANNGATIADGGASNNYIALTLLGGTGLPALPTIGSVNAAAISAPTGDIQVGQAFMYLPVTAGTKLLKNEMRTANAVTPFYRTTPNSDDKLWLNLIGDNNAAAQILIGYIPNTSLDFDPAYDGKQINSGGTVLSSIVNNQEMIIQSRGAFNQSDIVQLSFKASAVGRYIISLEKTEGIFNNGQNVFLIDNLLNVQTNLQNGAYNFVSEGGTFNNRFQIKYDSTLADASNFFDADNIIIFNNDNELNVKSIPTLSSISIFDLTGRKVFEKTNINNNNVVLNGFTPMQQTLFIKVIDCNSNIQTKKIIF